MRCLVLALACSLSGCGVIAGTVIDAATEVVTWPVKELVFLGAYEHDNPWEEDWTPLLPEEGRDEGDLLVGVCFSGGGSRAAYFATCALEELGRRKVPGSERSWLDEVDYVSSVSGGSLAAAYWCLNRGREGWPAGEAAFFARMREDMHKDFELRALARMVLGWGVPLVLTHYDRGDLMAAVWDANFLDGMTFGDLDPKGPALLVNAVCYDTGQKFVFTPLPLTALHGGEMFRRLRGDRLITADWGPSHVPFACVTLESCDSSIAACPLSTAVVASAAVPNLLGPVVLRDRRWWRDLHLGDGGIWDNHGLETMLQVMATRLEDEPGKRAVILVIDATGFFETEREGVGNLETVADFSDRPVTIAWLRAAGYAEAVFRRTTGELAPGSAYENLRLGVVTLYDDLAFKDEVQQGDATEVPAQSKVGEVVKDIARAPRHLVEAFTRRLRAVGTRFSLDDEDARAIEQAAPWIVQRELARIEAELLRLARRSADPGAAPPRSR